VTASSRPVVPLRQQVWFSQLVLRCFRLSLDLLGSCTAVETRRMPSFSHARELCLTPVFIFVPCLIMDRGMTLPFFVSIPDTQSPRPAVRCMPASRSRLSAVSDHQLTGHFSRLRSTRVGQALCCVPCLRQERAGRGHVEAAVASGNRAKMGMPRAQARGHARPHGPESGKLKPDAARPGEGGSWVQTATGGARP